MCEEKNKNLFETNLFKDVHVLLLYYSPSSSSAKMCPAISPTA